MLLLLFPDDDERAEQWSITQLFQYKVRNLIGNLSPLLSSSLLSSSMWPLLSILLSSRRRRSEWEEDFHFLFTKYIETPSNHFLFRSFPIFPDMQNGSCHGPREGKILLPPNSSTTNGGGTITLLSGGGVASGAAAVNGSVTVRYLLFFFKC